LNSILAFTQVGRFIFCLLVKDYIRLCISLREAKLVRMDKKSLGRLLLEEGGAV